MKIVRDFVVLSAIFSLSYGLKVLGVMPFIGKSHFAFGGAIVNALHEAGHDVTVLSPFPRKSPAPNYRDIVITIPEMDPENSINLFEYTIGPSATMALILYKIMGNDLVNLILKHESVNKTLQLDEKYDVCISEIFNIEALLGIAERFDCVLISYVTFGAVKWINDMTGNQMPTSYVPHPMIRFSDKMTFMERLENTFVSLLEDVAYEGHKMNQRRLYNKYFPNAKRSIDEMYNNSSIIFLNQHVSSTSARPLMPNMIEIGGIHINPAKDLPKELQNFIESAEHGVILFSMGSVLQAVNWPIEKRDAFVKAFGRLKQKVIWKYENDTLPNMPDNVMISKWIPQRDILAHPNVKLFMTHGGLMGSIEALVEGKPVLGFPLYGDQKVNMAKAVNREYGLQIYLDDITEDHVYEKLTEILTNSKYADNAKIFSARFKDRPMTPKELVVYWTEYAVRHRGAPHLQAQAANMSFIEFHSIDAYFVLAVIGFIVLYIEYKIVKFTIKKIFCGRHQLVDKNKKSK